MPAPRSIELREAAVAAYLRGEGSRTQISARFEVSRTSLGEWVRLQRHRGSVAPKTPQRPKSQAKLQAAEHEVLRELAQRDDQMTQEQMLEELAERTGKRVHLSTLQRTLRALGIRRVRAVRRSVEPPSARASASRPTRYTKSHRRDACEGYPSDLTDAEWEWVAPYFRPRTRPFVYPPRSTLNAIFYVLRTGCQWRMLPHDFPPWDTVYSAFRRWSKDGRLDAAHQALHQALRRSVGKNEAPTAAIIDSQSVKTTEKGGLAATTGARRSTAESDTSLSIPSGSC
jgi:transposase